MKMETRKVKVMTLEGKPVMDALAAKTLHITPEDVAASTSGKADCCAAAVACMRQFKVKRARVHLSRVYLEHPSIWVRYMTPGTLRAEIVSFDRGYKGFTGGDFTLRTLPPSSHGTHPKKPSGAANRKAKAAGRTKTARTRHKTTDVRNAIKAEHFE